MGAVQNMDPQVEMVENQHQEKSLEHDRLIQLSPESETGCSPKGMVFTVGRMLKSRI